MYSLTPLYYPFALSRTSPGGELRAISEIMTPWIYGVAFLEICFPERNAL